MAERNTLTFKMGSWLDVSAIVVRFSTFKWKALERLPHTHSLTLGLALCWSIGCTYAPVPSSLSLAFTSASLCVGVCVCVCKRLFSIQWEMSECNFCRQFFFFSRTNIVLLCLLRHILLLLPFLRCYFIPYLNYSLPLCAHKARAKKTQWRKITWKWTFSDAKRDARELRMNDTQSTTGKGAHDLNPSAIMLYIDVSTLQ